MIRPVAGVPLSDEQLIGMGLSGLYVLAIWPEARIHRQTLTALARTNKGDAKNGNHKLKVALSKAEKARLIWRDGDWVYIRHPEGLRRRALARVADPSHDKFLNLAAALPGLEQTIRMTRGDEAEIEAREREVRIIRALMNPYDGGVPRSPRAPRVLNTGRP